MVPHQEDQLYHLLQDHTHQPLRHMVHHLHHLVEVVVAVADNSSVEDTLLDTLHITLDQMEDVLINKNQEVETNLLYPHHWQLRLQLRLQLPQEKGAIEVIIDLYIILTLESKSTISFRSDFFLHDSDPLFFLLSRSIQLKV